MDAREKKHRRIAIPVLIVAGIFLILVSIAMFYYLPRNHGELGQTEYEVEEYFNVVNPTVDYGRLVGNESVIIYQMSFTLKAVGGDAHYVSVGYGMEGMPRPVDLGNMSKGEAIWVQLSFPSRGYLLEPKDEGLTVSIPIVCEETAGDVKVYLR